MVYYTQTETIGGILMTEYLFPKKIIAYEGVKNAENLLIKQDLQVSFVNTQLTIFEKGGYVILDIGKEL